jgi:hypothetical protein
MFDYVDYVIPTETIPHEYDELIDLSFGLITNTKLHTEWLKRRPRQSFVAFKYEIANVPITELRNLVYNRNIKAEDELLELVTRNIEGDFNLVHRISDYGTAIGWPGGASIEFTPKQHYTIFDWRKVIKKAKELHCIDSSLVNFADCLYTEAERNYYITDRVPMIGDRTILTKQWETIDARR